MNCGESMLSAILHLREMAMLPCQQKAYGSYLIQHGTQHIGMEKMSLLKKQDIVFNQDQHQ